MKKLYELFDLDSIIGNFLYGTPNSDSIRGTNGDDVIYGGEGRDTLMGGDGNDVLVADGNSSRLEEYMRGGNGDDTYVITSSSGATRIHNETANSGHFDKVVFYGMSILDFDIKAYDPDKDVLELMFTNDNAERVIIRIADATRHIESFQFADVTHMTGLNLLHHFGVIDPPNLISEPNAGLQDILHGNAGSLPINMSLADGADLSSHTYTNDADGENPYQFAHYYHVPELRITTNSEGTSGPNGYFNTKHFSNGPDIAVLNDGDNARPDLPGGQINFASGSDIVFGLGGDDAINGGNGADVIWGGDGNDWLSGGNYNDVLFGEAGDDRIEASSLSNVSFGGSGNDTLFGGNGFNVLHGGLGNDVIVSRSDTGEPDEVVKMPQSGVFVEMPKFAGGQANDDLFGGKGSDLFVFEFLLGAGDDPSVLYGDRPKIFDEAGNPLSEVIGSAVNWSHVSGLNGRRHEHWIDGIGTDVIHDFQAGIDTLGFVGHTVDVYKVEHVDVFNDGTLDTLITIRSNHMVHDHMTGQMKEGSHHNDLLGRVVLSDVIVDAAEFENNVIDIPVHNSLSNIVWTNNVALNEYVKNEYIFETDANENQVYRDLDDVLIDFSSFSSLEGGNGNPRAFDAYYSVSLKTLADLTSKYDFADAPRAAAIGTANDDIVYGHAAGTNFFGEAGDDLYLGSAHFSPQLGREALFGGSGNDTIYGMWQDDIIFGDDGDDYLLGSGVTERNGGGAEDVLFGGNGNDIVDPGLGGGWAFGGNGNDTMRSASDVPADFYNERTTIFSGNKNDLIDSPDTNRDDRILTDHLVGGAGADTFEFSVLVASDTGKSMDLQKVNPFNPDIAFHATFGIDVIHDFEKGVDSLSLNLYGSELGNFTFEVDQVYIDGVESAVINVISDRTDDIYGVDLKNNLSGVEYDETHSVGEIVLVGISASDAASLLDDPNTIQYHSDLMTARDYYARDMSDVALEHYFV